MNIDISAGNSSGPPRKMTGAGIIFIYYFPFNVVLFEQRLGQSARWDNYLQCMKRIGNALSVAKKTTPVDLAAIDVVDTSRRGKIIL